MKGLSHSVAVSFPNKSYFKWCLQSYTSLSVYSCSCNFTTGIRYKTWDCNAGNKLRLKTSSLQNFQCSWYIRFVYLYPKTFLYSLHPILHLLLMDNSQKSHKLKKKMHGGLRTFQLAWEHTKIGKPTQDGLLYKTESFLCTKGVCFIEVWLYT